MPRRFLVALFVLTQACASNDADQQAPDASSDLTAGVCSGMAQGSVCNVSEVSDFPEACCAVTEHCCPVSFERESCLPAGEACPTFCDQGTIFDVCPADSLCVYEKVLDLNSGDLCSTTFEEVRCELTCEPDKLCGDGCCGDSMACIDDCCVPTQL